MLYRLALGLLLALIPSLVGANCLPASQAPIIAVTALNAYTISKYGWEGDRKYDQVIPWCGSHPGLREFACNGAFDAALITIEDNVLEKYAQSGAAPIGKDIYRATCLANVLGAIGFGIYIRHALVVQIPLRIRL